MMFELGPEKHLISGGRYLVGSFPHKVYAELGILRHLVQIWDLGPVGMPPQVPVMVASYPFDAAKALVAHVKDAVSIIGESTLRIVIAYPKNTTPGQTL
jgi:hypothetical protein